MLRAYIYLWFKVNLRICVCGFGFVPGRRHYGCLLFSMTPHPLGFGIPSWLPYMCGVEHRPNRIDKTSCVTHRLEAISVAISSSAHFWRPETRNNHQDVAQRMRKLASSAHMLNGSKARNPILPPVYVTHSNRARFSKPANVLINFVFFNC